jgi:hypothetical protein
MNNLQKSSFRCLSVGAMLAHLHVNRHVSLPYLALCEAPAVQTFPAVNADPHHTKAQPRLHESNYE